MPVLRVDATAQGPRLHGGGDLEDGLAAALRGLAPGQPVVVLVHGYKFSPSHPAHDPHRHILAISPTRRSRTAVSWPRHLGFGRGRADEGLCIAFGWEARGSIWRAWASAEDAGRALADLVARIRRRHAGRVDMVAHSLGARVCLSAMRLAPAESLGRLILMAAAEFRGTATAAMCAPAARGAEVMNITTRENDLFDALAERLLRGPDRGDRTLGTGLALPGWLDIQIDAGHTGDALAALGFRLRPPRRRICHWSAYLRPGLMKFYSALLRDRHALPLPLPLLRRALAAPPDPRWSRLRARSGSALTASPAGEAIPSPAPARRSEKAFPAA